MAYYSNKNFAGFETYQEYLRSDLWLSLRNRRLSKNPICEVCCKCEATQVHHFAYSWKILAGYTIAPLVSICKCCHTKIEFSGGLKLSLEDSQDKLLSILVSSGSVARANELKRFVGIKDRLDVDSKNNGKKSRSWSGSRKKRVPKRGTCMIIRPMEKKKEKAKPKDFGCVIPSKVPLFSHIRKTEAKSYSGLKSFLYKKNSL